MTLSEIDKECKKLGLNYAYGSFDSPTNPPHLIGRIVETDNFSADNKVWYKQPTFRLELTTLKKDLELQKKIEDNLLKDIYWNKTEQEIMNEGVYNTSYFFNIKEE